MILNPIKTVLKIDPANLKAYSSGLLQGKAYRVMNTHLSRTLAIYNLTIPEWKLMGQLYDHGSMKLAELAERLSVEAPLVTILIDKLEKKRYVERSNDVVDRRAKTTQITDTGEKLLSELEVPVKETMKQLLQGVSKMDLIAYIRVLEAVVNNGDQLT